MTVTLLAAVASTKKQEMSQPRHISRNILLYDCHTGTQNHHRQAVQTEFSSDTSYSTDVNLSSAVQIGQRLAVIGDELNRTFETRRQSSMARVVRASMRFVSNCQAFVLNVLRSVKNFPSRVDHVEITGRSHPIPVMDLGWVCRYMLLVIALVVIWAVFVKLGFDD
ncbi:hypothetical protein AB205_0136500 [Pelobates cultripes]|uniref:Uncharacterized protein n=1 Tax=Pelobates cultripes TaxID=61616 RepID=A0AAD1W1W6_PELCU|nr:hypothetical protein AB205_0136500 [Pelobates cultripes]